MVERSFKPYELVWVRYTSPTGERYQAIGQAISYPDDSNAIMIRRVPGDPMTRVAVSLSAVDKLEGPQPKEVEYAVVGGSGRFPTDMFRYDHCVPVNFDIGEDGRAYLRNTELGKEFIVAKAVTGREPWTTGRWQSFLWGLRVLRRDAIVN